MAEGQGTEIGSIHYRLGIDDSDFKAALGQNAQRVEKAARETNTLATAQRRLEQSTDRATRQTREQSNALADLKKHAGQAIAGFAVFSAGQKAFQANREFDKGVREVFSLIPDASAKARTAMISDIERVSTQYGIAGTEAAKGFYEGLSAGVSTDGIGAFADVAANAAIGGVTDLATAVDVLTTATNSYAAAGLSSADAADSLFLGVKIGKTTFEELAQNMSDVLPIASSLGIGIDDVNASIATITSLGAPTAQSTTMIRNALAELSKSGTVAATNFERAAGQSFPAFVAAGGSVGEAMQAMTTYAESSGQRVTDLFSSIEGGQAALMLSGANFGKYNDTLDQFAKKSGAADTAANEMKKSVDFQFNQSMQELQKTLREVGVAITPLIMDAAKLAAVLGNFASMGGGAGIQLAKFAGVLVLVNKVSRMEGVQAGLTALRNYRNGLNEETAAANRAAGAQTRLARARASAGGALRGKGLGATVGLMAGIGAIQGAGDKSLVGSYKDDYGSGLGGTAAAYLSAGAAGIASSFLGDEITGVAGRKADAQAETDDIAQINARFKATQDARKQAQELADANPSLMSYKKAVNDAFASGDTEQISQSAKAMDDMAKAIATMKNSLLGSTDLFGENQSRFTKVDPAEVKDAQRALEDANRAEQDALDKVKKLRADSKTEARDLADAERDLQDAREHAADALAARNKAQTPEDQSLGRSALLSRFQEDVQSALSKGADVNALSSAGVHDEVIKKMLSIDESSPGTLHRIVSEGITSPFVQELNKGWGQIEGANQVIAEALNGEIIAAGQTAATAAYNQGLNVGKNMALGVKDGLSVDANGNPIITTGGFSSPFVGPIAPKPGSGSGGIGLKVGSGGGGSVGMAIGTMNVISNSPQDFVKNYFDWAARGNLAGGN